MTQRTETWLPVVDWEGLYEVSDLARVRSLDRTIGYRQGGLRRWRGRILRQWRDSHGYFLVGLCRNGVQQISAVHLLVLEAFDRPRPAGMVGLHGPGGKHDNTPGNLRWGTKAENQIDRHRDGTMVQAKLTPSNIPTIRQRHAAGASVASLAREYGTAPQTMHRVVKRVTWRHIP